MDENYTSVQCTYSSAHVLQSVPGHAAVTTAHTFNFLMLTLRVDIPVRIATAPSYCIDLDMSFLQIGSHHFFQYNSWYLLHPLNTFKRYFPGRESVSVYLSSLTGGPLSCC